MTYCDTCDFIGPREFEGDTLAAFVEVHRAMHAIIREISRFGLEVAAAYRSATDKATKADYTLVNGPAE